MKRAAHWLRELAFAICVAMVGLFAALAMQFNDDFEEAHDG